MSENKMNYAMMEASKKFYNIKKWPEFRWGLREKGPDRDLITLKKICIAVEFCANETLQGQLDMNIYEHFFSFISFTFIPEGFQIWWTVNDRR